MTVLLKADRRICELKAEQAGPRQFLLLSYNSAMDSYIVWAIMCLGLALVLFIIELFVPSAGILGILSASALVAGIVLLFLADATIGIFGALIALVTLPFLIAMMIKLWPNTPIARLLMIKSAPPPTVEDHAQAGQPSAQLVGARGIALSELRPVGVCQINDQRVECVAQSGLIRTGTPIRVIDVDGLQVRVAVDET